MWNFVKSHITRKVIVRTIFGIAFAYMISLLVFINVNSINLYRTFVKVHHSLEAAETRSSFIYNRLHVRGHRNESKFDNPVKHNRSPDRYVIYVNQSWSNSTNDMFAFWNVSFTTAAKQKTIISSNIHLTPVPKIDTIDRPLTCDRCFNVKFTYLINNEHICIPNQQSVKLVLLITSSSQNKMARTAIRATWLTHTNHNRGHVRYVFLLGQSQNDEQIYNENAITRDIIMADFQDTYSNLTFKTLMGFQWAEDFCKTAKFIMKTDDDMYVNIPGLIMRITENNESLQTALGGSCTSEASPIRDKRSKWYASYNSYPQNSYPGFCSGTGYVTSMNVVSNIIQVSKNIPFFHLEDVYVSLCIRKLGYKLQTLKGFMYRPRLDPCLYKNNNLVTAHQVPITWMHQIWKQPCYKPVNN